MSPEGRVVFFRDSLKADYPSRRDILTPTSIERTIVNTKGFAIVGSVLVLLAAPLYAHHAISAVFDTSKQIKIVGELTDVDWVNPHVFIHIKGKDSTGATVQWKVESSPPAWFRRVGASSNTFAKHIGETVTVDAQPSRNGSTYSYLVKITFANGDSLEGATSAEAEAAQPRK
jgi:hypothetical protein